MRRAFGMGSEFKRLMHMSKSLSHFWIQTVNWWESRALSKIGRFSNPIE
jgi:hypothetical protein